MLKRLAILSALMIAVTPAAGCAQITAAIPAIGPAAVRESPLTVKASIALEVAYNVPMDAYLKARKAGLLSADQIKAIEGKRSLMRKIRDAGREAYTLGEATTFNQQVEALKTLGAQVRALLPVTQ